MSSQPIAASLLVGSVDEAVTLYTEHWQLFRMLNQHGEGASDSAVLEYVDEKVAFELVVLQGADGRDVQGRLIRAARQAHLWLPKTDFWTWAAQLAPGQHEIEQVPWRASIHLEDRWGHMLSIWTGQEPQAPHGGGTAGLRAYGR